VLRDLAAFGIGGWGVIHEALKDKPEVMVLAFFGVLMVAPGMLAAHWLATSGTGGQSSQPPLPPASPSPSPQPSNGSPR